MTIQPHRLDNTSKMIMGFFPPLAMEANNILERDLGEQGLSLQQKRYLRNVIDRFYIQGTSTTVASLTFFAIRFYVEDFDSRIECQDVPRETCVSNTAYILGVHMLCLSYFILQANTNQRHLEELKIQSEDPQLNELPIEKHSLGKGLLQNLVPFRALRNSLTLESEGLHKPGASLAQQRYIHNLIDLFHNYAISSAIFFFTTFCTTTYMDDEMDDEVLRKGRTLIAQISLTASTFLMSWHILKKMSNLRALKEVQCEIINSQKGTPQNNPNPNPTY